MTIIADIKNFTLAHPIYVIENNNIIMTTKCTLKNMPEVLSQLAYTHNADKVIVKGPIKFAKPMHEQIRDMYTAKYSKECSFTIE